MKRLVVLAICLAVVASGCSRRGAVVVGPIGRDARPLPSRSGEPSVPPTNQPPIPPSTASPSTGRTMTFEIWFQMGERLYRSSRVETFDPAVATAAMHALLAGPTSREAAAGAGTSIPSGTRLLHLSIDAGVATVDLSSAYESGGGSLSETMRLAQVVFTLTQFRSVDSVRFELDGRPVDVFSGEGIVLAHPATRDDYEALLPAIVVETPASGQGVQSPVTISGTADVFEATVSYEILDGSGTKIAEGFTTATCGSGCRGDFSKAASFHVGNEQPGTIVVFEASAKDGSHINVVRVPVTLVP